LQPAAEPFRADVVRIADLPSSPESSYDKYYADYQTEDSSDFGWAKGKALLSLKQTEFSLKQFAKRMGLPNLSIYNKWEKVWGGWFLQKMHRSIILGQHSRKQQQDGLLNWETAVAYVLETFES
jgi:hypothetical protein